MGADTTNDGDAADPLGSATTRDGDTADPLGSATADGADTTNDGDTADPLGSATTHDGDTVRYLGLGWIRELTREVAASETLAELAQEHAIGVTQVVTDGPEGDVTYHLQVRDGEASFGAGPADPEDVRMQQDWSTAVAVATGELNAQEAFITGRILLFGDQQALMGAQPVFGALDSVFASVRDRTRYE